MPPHGGELAIWDLKPDQDEYEALRIPESDGLKSYGLKREPLGEPAYVITPRPGDLILFDAQRVHAVYASVGGARVTISFFIVLTAEGELLIYS